MARAYPRVGLESTGFSIYFKSLFALDKSVSCNQNRIVHNSLHMLFAAERLECCACCKLQADSTEGDMD